jgi:peptidoglycan/LPS O-acetylase OafA/YrhL
MLPPKISSRLPSLDGWRAVSIIMVLGWHVAMASPNAEKPFYAWLFDGMLGVRFFFTISGFLITWLLLQEAEHSGRVDLQHFYIRRFLRILPVYFTFIWVLWGLQLFTPFKETAMGWLGMVTFTRNYANGTIASGHFWSLAVEEQFYLVWPGLLVLMGKRSFRFKTAILTVPILAAPIFRLGTYLFYFEHQHLFSGSGGIHLKPAGLENLFNGSSFFCNFDSLAFGCLSAIFLAGKRMVLTGLFPKKPALLFVAALLLVEVPHFTEFFHLPGLVRVLLITCGPTLQALGFSAFLLHSLLQPDWPGYRPLNWKWVGWLGMLSYSLYIWQQIFCFRVWAGPDVWKDFPDALWAWLWLVPALAVACLSYYGLERPLFRLRSRFRNE